MYFMYPGRKTTYLRRGTRQCFFDKTIKLKYIFENFTSKIMRKTWRIKWYGTSSTSLKYSNTLLSHKIPYIMYYCSVYLLIFRTKLSFTFAFRILCCPKEVLHTFTCCPLCDTLTYLSPPHHIIIINISIVLWKNVFSLEIFENIFLICIWV